MLYIWVVLLGSLSLASVRNVAGVARERGWCRQQVWDCASLGVDAGNGRTSSSTLAVARAALHVRVVHGACALRPTASHLGDQRPSLPMLAPRAWPADIRSSHVCVCPAAAACPRRTPRQALHSTMLHFSRARAAAVGLVLVLVLCHPSPAAADTSPDTSLPASALCAFQTQAPVGFFRGRLLQHLKGVTLEQCTEACEARNKLGSSPLCRAFQYDATAQKCGLKKYA